MKRPRSVRSLPPLLLALGLLAGPGASCGPSRPAVAVPRPAPGRALDPDVAAAVDRAAAAAEAALGGPASDAAEALLELARLYDAQALFDLARASYGAAARLAPHADEAWYQRARMDQEAGDPGAALAALARVRTTEGPRGAAVAWRRGLLLLALDRLEEADAAFAQAVERAPADVSGWIGRARVALQDERHDAAAGLLREALERAPGDGVVCGLLARALRARGDVAGAARALAQARAPSAAWRDPWTVRVMEHAVGYGSDVRRAEALLAAGRAKEAGALLDRLAAERPDDTTVATMRASVHMDHGELDEALRIVDAALVVSPEHFRLHLDRALILRGRGDARGALVSARRAVELLPGYASGHALVAELYATLGAPAAAREALEAARRKGAPPDLLASVEARIRAAEARR